MAELLSTLFNSESAYLLCLAQRVQDGYPHDRACSRISKEEVRNALRRIKPEKAVGLEVLGGRRTKVVNGTL